MVGCCNFRREKIWLLRKSKSNESKSWVIIKKLNTRGTKEPKALPSNIPHQTNVTSVRQSNVQF